MLETGNLRINFSSQLRCVQGGQCTLLHRIRGSEQFAASSPASQEPNFLDKQAERSQLDAGSFHNGAELRRDVQRRLTHHRAKRLAGRHPARLENGFSLFANLPEPRAYRWDEGLTEEKMATCAWVKPEIEAQINFANWTYGNHLPHSSPACVREDKRARDIVSEQARESQPSYQLQYDKRLKQAG